MRDTKEFLNSSDETEVRWEYEVDEEECKSDLGKSVVKRERLELNRLGEGRNVEVKEVDGGGIDRSSWNGVEDGKIDRLGTCHVVDR